jgi:DNA-binding transcriptional MerR regulator
MARRVFSSTVYATTARPPSNRSSPRCRSQQLLSEMRNRSKRSTSIAQRPRVSSRAIQLFEPPADSVYTIDATSRIVAIPRRMIVVYCKHKLLSPAFDTVDHGYYFDGDGIRALRRIEALRSACGDDFAGIKIILDLTAALERLRSDIRLLSRARTTGPAKESHRRASPISSRRRDVKSNYRKKKK